eukprot:gi/632987220/ref/XP_007910671.1/ PREDICTED: leucine-rich repeat-containing protein 69-like [Callorhinchus milii]
MAELVLRALRGNSTSLNLTNKQLQQVPIAVIKLKALRTLRISNNYLIDLPPEIKTLRELTELNLGNNAFQHVPEVLFHMISLQKLQLYGNLISEITSGLFDEVCIKVQIMFIEKAGSEIENKISEYNAKPFKKKFLLNICSMGLCSWSSPV